MSSTLAFAGFKERDLAETRLMGVDGTCMGCRGSHHWSKVKGASPFHCCFFHAPQAAAPANLFIASFCICSVQLKRRQRFTQESAAGVLLQSSAAPITRTRHASPQIRGDQQLKSIKMHQDAPRCIKNRALRAHLPSGLAAKAL